MALQSGLAASRILIIVGASLAGSILVKNGNLSDFLDDSYKVLVRHLKNKKESSEHGHTDASLVSQLNKLKQELSLLVSERSSIMVVTEGSRSNGLLYFAFPALLIGATGYGYLRWKGFSLSDFMYVTKRSMSSAVATVSKQMEQVSAALSATKRHLTSRLDHLSTNLDQSNELQIELKNEVLEVRGDISRYGLEIETVQRLVQSLGMKIDTIESKQDIANSGVVYLCNFVEKMQASPSPEPLQGASRPRLEQGPANSKGFGLKELQSISSALGTVDSTNEISASSGPSIEQPATRLQRNLTAKFTAGYPRNFWAQS